MSNDTNEEGVLVETYPFLEGEDPKDEKLMKYVMQSRPFALGRNEKGPAWEDVATTLSKTATDHFPKGISSKAVKDRFNTIMKAMKSKEAKAPIRSGTDDENISDFISLAESLYHDFDSCQQDAVGKKDNSLAQKRKDREHAEVLRRTSLGELSRGDLIELRRRSSSTGDQSDSGRMTPHPSSGGKQSFATDFLSSTQSMSSAISESAQAKTELKKRQLELKKEQLEEQKKMDEHKRRMKEEERKEERKQREHQRQQDAMDRAVKRQSRAAANQLALSVANILGSNPHLLQNEKKKDDE